MDAKDSFPSPSREAASGDGARTQEDPPQRDPSAATDSAPAADEPAKAPLRRSCVNCTQARKKCQLADGLPEGIAERVCERCQRLGIECEVCPSNACYRQRS